MSAFVSIRFRYVSSKFSAKYPGQSPIKRTCLQRIINRYNNDEPFVIQYKGGRPVTATTPGKCDLLVSFSCELLNDIFTRNQRSRTKGTYKR